MRKVSRFSGATCTSVTKDGKASKCGVRSIPARRIDELVTSLLSEMGKHPEVIEKTVGALKRSSLKEIGPIKVAIDKLSREMKVLEGQEERLAALAKNPDSGDFGPKLLKQGREASEQRNLLGQEREKLNLQVMMKEVGLVDSETVAAQLRNFGAIMDALNPEDQKDLIRLMVREVRVNRFDPQIDKLAPGTSMIPVKIRTHWFVLNITFFSNDLFSRLLREEVGKFVSQHKWLPE